MNCGGPLPASQTMLTRQAPQDTDEHAMDTVINSTKERLQRGELALGFAVRVARSVEVARAVRTVGFDWLFIDFEHGAMSIETAAALAIAGLDAGVTPLARIPKGEYSLATRLLDNGALGIVAPHMETAEEAQAAVAALRFPRLGRRAVYGSQPHFGFGRVATTDLMAALNAATLVVAMVETARGVANADAIAAVEGIDVLLVGTNDLCVDLGIAGELGHPRVADAYAAVIAACRRHNKWPGMGGVYDEALMRRYVGMGCRFLQAGGDLGFIMEAGAQRAAFLRGLS
jgi:4-hydroxy-2-oxoheptanedioate aldolase